MGIKRREPLADVEAAEAAGADDHSDDSVEDCEVENSTNDRKNGGDDDEVDDDDDDDVFGDVDDEDDGVPVDAEDDEEEKRARERRKELDRITKKQKRLGVVYLSHIPPRMTPARMKQILSEYCEVTRIFLRPESDEDRKARKKRGGSNSRRYVEGWVEFSNKKKAKKIAMMLNNNPIGGDRRSFFHGDLWTIKYLSKFKWNYLTEKISLQNMVREQRMRQEISQGTKEIHFIESKMQQAKEIAAMKAKRAAKPSASTDSSSKSGSSGGKTGAKASVPDSSMRRSFPQRHGGTRREPGSEASTSTKATVSSSLLSKLFGNK